MGKYSKLQQTHANPVTLNMFQHVNDVHAYCIYCRAYSCWKHCQGNVFLCSLVQIPSRPTSLLGWDRVCRCFVVRILKKRQVLLDDPVCDSLLKAKCQTPTQWESALNHEAYD